MQRRSHTTRLVIGIGNPLRGDDGVGALLAEQAAVLTTAEPDGPVAVRSVQQLTPELAEELSHLEGVLFIDAWLAPAEGGPASGLQPRLDPVPLEVSGDGSSASHHLEPAELLAITAALYGRTPRGSWLRVPAYAFGHGTELSAPLQASLPQSRLLLQQWLKEGAAHA